MSETKLQKRRKVKRRLPRPIARSSHPFVQKVVEMSQTIDGDQISQLFESMRKHGLDIGEVDEFLVDFDWSTALQLLPFLMEFAESFKELSGAEKEQRVVSLVVKLAKLAKQDKYVDEDAILSLRIIISTIVDVSRGEFALNEKTSKNFVSLIKHGGSWATRHVACGCCSRKK